MQQYSDKYTFPLLKLNTDSNPKLQPEKTYRFAKNAVLNVDGLLQNEPSTIFKINIEDYLTIGHIYIGDNEILLFLVKNDDSDSGIGIYKEGTFEWLIPPTASLNLKKNSLVNATFRKIRGCEKVVYFTDNINKPRKIDIDKINDYFDDSGNLIEKRLTLISDYTIPTLTPEVRNLGGSLDSGSYNFAIQYLTEDMAGSNWITISGVVNVYKDNVENNPYEITGSYSNDKKDTVFDSLFSDLKTSKSIQLTIDNKDNEYFSYYRIAVIRAINATGMITDVLVSPPHSINQDVVIIDGTWNGYSKVTKEEIFLDKPDVERVKFIKQLDSRLILANGEGKQEDWCSLQKYASKIKVDYVTEAVDIENTKSENSSKSVFVPKMGFAAGEVYAFGIVYVYADGTKSPVYHIPGRCSDCTTSNMDYYVVEEGTYEPRDCADNNYWGVDFDGNTLEGKHIRHHKFPEKYLIPTYTNNKYKETVTLVKINWTSPESWPSTYTLKVTINYHIGNKDIYVDKAIPITATSLTWYTYTGLDIPQADTVTIHALKLVKTDGTEGDATNISAEIKYLGLSKNSIATIVYPKFSNIDKPSDDVIGFYIVVAERDSVNRRVVDRGIANQLSYHSSSGKALVYHLWQHKYLNSTPTRNTFWLKSPKIMNDNNDISFSKVQYEGVFKGDVFTQTLLQENAYPGSSSKGYLFGLVPGDTDGMDWKLIYRAAQLRYFIPYNLLSTTDMTTKGYSANVLKKTYLSACNKMYGFITDVDLVNATLDSPAVVVYADIELPYVNTPISNKAEVNVVTLINENNNIHNELDFIKYYHTHTDVKDFSSTSVEIKEGDVFYSVFDVQGSTYYKTDKPRRLGETISNILAAWVVVGLGIAATILTGGAALPVAIAVVAEMLTFVGIVSTQVMSEVIKDLTEGELLEALDTEEFKGETGDVIDDTIYSMGEYATGIILDSEINADLRLRTTNGAMGANYSNGISSLKEFYKSKYLFTDDAREDDIGVSLRFIPTPDVFKANLDYSRLPREKVYFSIPKTYDCNSKCLEKWSNRILWSERSFSEDKADTYRTFLPNNYRDLTSEYGNITAIEILGEKLYVFTDRMLFVYPPNYQERINDDFVTFIGTGEFLGQGPQRLIDDSIGGVGTRFSRSVTKSNNSILFVDDINHKIYLISSSGLKDLCQGVYGKIKDFTTLTTNEYLEQLHLSEYNGFISVFDELNNRFIITKQDRFEHDNQTVNLAETLSFSLNVMAWVSNHSYFPSRYCRTDNGVISVDGSLDNINTSRIYSHENTTSYGSYYDNTEDFVIDLAIPTNLLNQFFNEFIRVKVEASEYNSTNKDFNPLRNVFFTSVLFYNDRQISGLKSLEVKEENETYLLNQISNNYTRVLVDKNNGVFSVNDIRDYRTDYTEPIFIKDKLYLYLQGYWYNDKVINPLSLDLNKPWNNLEPFKDNYLGIRLIYNNNDSNIRFKVLGISTVTNFVNS